ncbi:MAG: exosortase U [Planctomycetaceae bacterium]|nr:exosortase U [Planctomycetaceae bacterium]
MIGIQFAQKHFQLTVKAQPPGVSRGDMPLTESSLSASIGDWNRVSFRPPEEVTAGQFWWSHSWQYENAQLQAIVSYDQADWNGWHELSECYSASGWTLVSRKIVTDPDGWDFVVSRFEKDNLHAVLAFSLFFDDGDYLAPWELSLREAVKQNMTTLDAMRDRQRHSSDRANARAFQCQIFVPAIQKLPEGAVADILELHKATRVQFRSLWLSHVRETRE